MAHPRIIAQRQAIAVQRLMAAAHKLAKQHDLKEQGKALDGATARDPAMAQMLQAEALADLLEGLIVLHGPEAIGDKAATIKASEQPPVTVETVVEKPLETTETVEIVEVAAAPIKAPATRVGVPRGKGR